MLSLAEFGQWFRNWSNGSGEHQNKKNLDKNDGLTDRQTDNGHQAIRKAQLSI